MINRLKECREIVEITQKELSELTGISRSTISEYEHGRYLPRVDDALKIAKVLGAPVEEIFILEMSD